MGDPQIGRAMGELAAAAWKVRKDKAPPSQEEALAILDMICNPYRGRDPEFESTDPDRPGFIHPDYAYETDPTGPIGRLIVIAFHATPDEMLLGRGEEAPWLDGPYDRFCARYDFG